MSLLTRTPPLLTTRTSKKNEQVAAGSTENKRKKYSEDLCLRKTSLGYSVLEALLSSERTDPVQGTGTDQAYLTTTKFLEKARNCIHLSEGTHYGEVDPAERWAFLELIGRKVIIHSRERRREAVYDILEPESKDLVSRLRYGRRVRIEQHWEYLGPRFGKGFSCLESALADVWGVEKRRKFVEIVQFFTYGLRIEKDVEEMLKYLSGYAKKFGCGRFAATMGGDELAWKAFVNLEVLGGFMSVNDEDLRKQVVEWRGGDIVHKSVWQTGGLMTEDAFLSDFTNGVRSFFRHQLKRSGTVSLDLAQDGEFSYHYFVTHPALWGGGGSSSEASVIPGVRKSKWATALGLDQGRVESWLSFEPIQRNKVIGKRETGKIRAVIASDDQLYLAMAYVSHWIEGLAKGSRISTLFMSSEQTVKMWSELVASCRNGETTKLPLDQSHFDWQQNKRMLRIVISEMKSFVMPFVNAELTKDVLAAFQYIDTALQNPKGFVLFGKTGEHFPIEKGVMSGWRWTALIDTICNYGEMWCACAFCTKMGLLTSPINLCVQGDDDCVEFVDNLVAGGICTAYQEMSFEVNPGKFFMSRIQNEYLRLVATRNGVVSGYPARAIPSIIARNPLTVDPPKGVFRVRETFNQWGTLFGRCQGLAFRPDLRRWSTSHTHGMMMSDLCGATGLSKLQLWRLEHTPASMGGLGVTPFLLPEEQLGISVVDGSLPALRTESKYTGGLLDRTPRVSWTHFHWDHVERELPGLNTDKSELTEAGLEIDDDALNGVLSTLLQPKGKRPEAQRTILIRPKEDVRVRRASTMTPNLEWGSTVRMPIPHFKRVIRDSVLRSAVIGTYASRVTSSTYDHVKELLLESESFGDSDRFWAHGGKRMWCMWMRGDLESAQLSIPGMAGFAVGMLNDLAGNWIWSKVSNRSSFTHLDWLHYCTIAQGYALDFAGQMERCFHCLLLS